VPATAALLETGFHTLRLFRRGKVRDVYELSDPTRLLMVATDRISAFDHVLGSGIPDKGRILTQLSAFWFGHLADVVRNHVVSLNVDEFPAETRPYAAELVGRAMLVRRTRPERIECVARGYLSGSGWKEYQQAGAVCGIELPRGLRESDRLPEPIFTPATKAESGHDLNISAAEASSIVGAKAFDRMRTLTLELYRRAATHAASRGIILADTKFEFGWADGPGGQLELLLIDEVLTPDSSRFWPADAYRPGGPQPSFDKQYVRDYLESIRWDKQPPVPALPADVVSRTREKYLDALRRLTGRDLA
jgi:phosphoribosylaminoimidazole-succinocarboxamide synthase